MRSEYCIHVFFRKLLETHFYSGFIDQITSVRSDEVSQLFIARHGDKESRRVVVLFQWWKHDVCALGVIFSCLYVEMLVS